MYWPFNQESQYKGHVYAKLKLHKFIDGDTAIKSQWW